MSGFSQALIRRTEELRDSSLSLSFPGDVIPYHPLSYAWAVHREYLSRYVRKSAPLLFLGMNPGPFGMAQTGIPFGEIDAVTTYLKLSGEIAPFPGAHEKRPVTGFECTRSEVSGRRLWTLIAELYPDAGTFPDHLSVMNYCPLLFADKGPGGKNIVPEKLAKPYREQLEALCDSYLDDIVTLIRPEVIVGVGIYAEKKGKASVARTGLPIRVTSVLHPSPASPAANRGWSEQAVASMKERGVWDYL